ncbi:MAG: DUF3179 domain-containing protein [Chloroflexi bacterium]|nr:DUF3179 domain-containing protein [Chloroflexota bacterium]
MARTVCFILSLFTALVSACGPGPTPTYPTALPATSFDPRGPRTKEFAQLLARDAILPIYHPQFVRADASRYAEDELVMGVAINGEAKAYPVTLLTFREMVNDELAGVPILVTF